MKDRTVYVIQEIPGTKSGNPKINIMGASKYGEFKFLLPELSQMIFSPGPLIFKLRNLLKNFKKDDYFGRINKNLEKLTTGIYILKINTASGLSQTEKIIKY